VVSMPDVAMIAMSWVTDETNDSLKCLNLLRKLLSFTANLCAVEEMPVLIGCSLRLSLDDIKQVFCDFSVSLREQYDCGPFSNFPEI
jgi:hypothetical protein